MTALTFIGIEKILELEANQEPYILIEVLSPDSYAKGHLPHAINIPYEKIDEEAPKLDKSKTIVTYCNGYTCSASTDAAKKFMELGFKKVYDFKMGKPGWEKAGLPVTI
jgi:rhodanese-related sulfurtransferase